jgi:hypothetical protein
MACGFLFAPVERLVALIILSLIRPLRKSWRNCYSPKEAFKPEFFQMLAWFADRPSHKTYWEWELFHYFIYWTIFSSLSCSFALLIYLTHNSQNTAFQELVAAGTLILLFYLRAAIARSEMMGMIHEHYKMQWKRELASESAAAIAPRVVLSALSVSTAPEPMASKPASTLHPSEPASAST